MKTALQLVKIIAISYVIICGLLYFLQEKLIFFPQKLPLNYTFVFNNPFDEINVTSTDSTLLNGVLFTTEKSKGLVFYLHGNAGCLQSWGEVATAYTRLHYDVFMPDYRGYGKSGGSIYSEQQFYDDMQLMYDSLKKRYQEKDIVVLGYSIGTGVATRLAAVNHPRLLVLQAPYYSLSDMLRHRFHILPSVILKYKFATNKWLPACTMPVIIFHGDKDEVIYYGSSLKLQTHFKAADTLITLQGQGHNGITDNPHYTAALEKILQ